jgi:hypothetical protein
MEGPTLRGTLFQDGPLCYRDYEGTAVVAFSETEELQGCGAI